MKNIYFFLLVAGCFVSNAVFGQYASYNMYVVPGQCDTIWPAPPDGPGVDSFFVINPPQTGAVIPAGSTGVYCADSAFNSSDQMLVYGCYGDSSIVVCDTFLIYLFPQNSCSLQVFLLEDSGICIGGYSSYSAIVNNSSGSMISYLWNNGETANNACLSAPGQNLCVTVTDNLGCVGVACSNSGNCHLQVLVSQNTTCTGPLPGITADVSGGTPPYNYSWSFGAYTQTVCNMSSGSYCVTVTDADNCVATQCYSIPGIGNCVFYSLGQPALTGQPTYFNAEYDNSIYTAASINWDFGDSSVASGSQVTHLYAACGLYRATVQIVYTTGDTCTFSDYVYACDSAGNIPSCQSSFASYITTGNSLQFVDYSVYNPVSWIWDFGDGDSSTIQNPLHTYDTQGSWQVCLTTTDANGCSSTSCNTVSNISSQDLSAYLFHQSTVTPGFPVWTYLDYYNAGTTLMNGTVTYRYPVGTTVTATSQAPVLHDVTNRLLTFTFNNLLPLSSNYIYVELLAANGLPLGSIAEDTLWVAPLAGDINPSDNISFINDSVVGSWDPNDKAVAPKGIGQTGEVPANTTEVSYRIRFQNTGSAPAHNVLVADKISPNIELSSVRVVNATHDHTWQLTGDTLKVWFANINLPDSGADYSASQGAILVQTRLKPGLLPGTQLFNTAAIYFDFNAPVITNTVITTLKNELTGLQSGETFAFSLQPNPVNEVVYLTGEFDRGATYDLFNRLGQLVRSGNLYGNAASLSVAGLPSGVYLVKVRSGNQSAVKRLIIAH